MSDLQIPTYTLSNGSKIPALQLGTWESPKAEARKAVKHFLEIGGTAIDTAYIYDNEDAVGQGIKDAGIPREKLWVTTKLWLTDLKDPQKALDKSLELLGLDYVDLYLIHWPFALTEDKQRDDSIDFVQAWANLQKVDRKKARAIGVSNFDIENLTKLLNAPTTTEVPAVNQVEIHIALPQFKLVEFCQSKNITVEAYSPLGRGKLDHPVLKKIAEKHNSHPANVTLSWGLSRGLVVLPKSVTPSRIESNTQIIKLDPEDIEEINKAAEKNTIDRNCNFGGLFGIDTFHGEADSKN